MALAKCLWRQTVVEVVVVVVVVVVQVTSKTSKGQNPSQIKRSSITTPSGPGVVGGRRDPAAAAGLEKTVQPNGGVSDERQGRVRVLGEDSWGQPPADGVVVGVAPIFDVIIDAALELQLTLPHDPCEQLLSPRVQVAALK